MMPSIEMNSVTTIFPMGTSVSGISRETLRSSSQRLRELVEHGRPAVVRIRSAGLSDHMARHLGSPTKIGERDGDGEIDVAVAPGESLGLVDLHERPARRVLLAVVVGDHRELERAAR